MRSYTIVRLGNCRLLLDSPAILSIGRFDHGVLRVAGADRWCDRLQRPIVAFNAALEPDATRSDWPRYVMLTGSFGVFGLACDDVAAAADQRLQLHALPRLARAPQSPVQAVVRMPAAGAPVAAFYVSLPALVRLHPGLVAALS